MKATIETENGEPVLVLVVPLRSARRAAPVTIETTGEEIPPSRPGLAKAPSNVLQLRKVSGQ